MQYIPIAAVIAASTLVSAAPTTSSSAQGKWEQCGGLNWTGSTTCVDGSVCTEQNSYYWQCLPTTFTSSAVSTASSCVVIPSSAAVSERTTASSSTNTFAVTSSSGVQALYAQCGGESWTGGTECVSGSTCVEYNAWYSQCVPGTSSDSASSSAVVTMSTEVFIASTQSSSTVVVTTPTTSATPTTTSVSTPTSTTISTSSSSTHVTSSSSAVASSTHASSTSVTSATASASSGSLPFLGGVNTAGYDFSVYTDGSFSGTGQTPPSSQYAHFANQGANIFRIPFAWQLMTPTLGGDIDATWFSTYDTTVQAALATGAYVILDLHNYARWNGGIVGQGGPTNAQFASLWTQLAAKYGSNEKVIFGLMNEPHDLNDISTWAASLQAVITAVRGAGSINYLLLPGSTWSHASALPTEAGPDLLTITDPLGGTDKLIFDVHQYLDSDGSGTSNTCATNNVDVLTTLVSWLKTNGRQALLSETGGGSTSSCETYLNQELSYVKENSDYIVGYTVWAAGAFDTSYALTVTPNSDGTDQAIWTDAVVPNLP